MPAGKYYVGDLCYVMTDAEWDLLHPMLFPERQRTMVEGEHFVNGKKIAIYGTAFGDGTYTDQHVHGYDVDSGSIGCILVSDIDASEQENIVGSGNVHDFPSGFHTSSDGSCLTFGHIEIETDEDEWPEDDEDEEEED